MVFKMKNFKAILEEKKPYPQKKRVYFNQFLHVLYFRAVNEATVLAVLFFLVSLGIVSCADRLVQLCSRV